MALKIIVLTDFTFKILPEDPAFSIGVHIFSKANFD
jgi:hypothetical protein